MFYFLLVLGGGNINRPGQLPPPPPPPTPGEDNQGGGQDIAGQLAPRGWFAPGGKLSRGQDKLGHRLKRNISLEAIITINHECPCRI